MVHVFENCFMFLKIRRTHLVFSFFFFFFFFVMKKHKIERKKIVFNNIKIMFFIFSKNILENNLKKYAQNLRTFLWVPWLFRPRPIAQ